MQQTLNAPAPPDSHPAVHAGACVLLALVIVMAGTAASGQTATAGRETMQGKTVFITGSTDGLGREVARRVARLGAHVIVHGRNRDRGAAVVAEIVKAGGSARFFAADLASLQAVRGLAEAVRTAYPRIDVLINNAGVLVPGGVRQVSADGHELHFAVNYLSGFLLTRLLLPTILESAPARIINVASVAQSPIDFSDLMLERPGRAAQGYGQSKLAQVVFTMDLARELAGRGVAVVALHPATLMNTSMVRAAGMPAQATVDEGATAVMNLVTGPIESGQYYNGLTPARANPQAYDAEVQARLRALSMELAGLQ